MTSRQKSPIWKYFEILENDETKAKCHLCSSLISRGGTGRTATASAMINHLKYKHKTEHLEYEKAVCEKKEKRKDEQQASTSRETCRQLTLQESIDIKKNTTLMKKCANHS